MQLTICIKTTVQRKNRGYLCIITICIILFNITPELVIIKIYNFNDWLLCRSSRKKPRLQQQQQDDGSDDPQKYSNLPNPDAVSIKNESVWQVILHITASDFFFFTSSVSGFKCGSSQFGIFLFNVDFIPKISRQRQCISLVQSCVHLLQSRNHAFCHC